MTGQPRFPTLRTLAGVASDQVCTPRLARTCGLPPMECDQTVSCVVRYAPHAAGAAR
jgi:hypothetical protein